jgi:hypothetical protein
VPSALYIEWRCIRLFDMVDRGAIANGGLGPADAVLLQDRAADIARRFCRPGNHLAEKSGN